MLVKHTFSLKIVAIFVAVFNASGASANYPVVDAVKGLPHPSLITVYPDDSDGNLYYFVPTSVSLVYENGKPRLGVQYWGLTGFDPSGAGAALTFSVKPSYDKAVVEEVANAIKEKNPGAKFAFPALVESSMDVIINGQFIPEQQNTNKAQLKAGTVDGTQGFTIGLNQVGARAFSQGVAQNSDVLGARYTYKFTGVAKRLRAKVTINQKRVYDHFKLTASSSSWWGWASSSWTSDWKSLLGDGSIKLEILEGGEADTDAYILEVFKIIVNAKINGEGMFKPELKPGGIETSESSKFGWGFRASASWERFEEKNALAIEINKQKLEDREFEVGLTFPAVCAKFPESFADLTRLGNNCIDPKLYADTVKTTQECYESKIKRLDNLLSKKLIDTDMWNKQVEKANSQPCYSATVANMVPDENYDQAIGAIEKLKSSGKLNAAAADNIISLMIERPNAVSPSFLKSAVESMKPTKFNAE